MKSFEEYKENCEQENQDREYMARGVNVNSDETLAKDILWMSIGKNMSSSGIAGDPKIAQYSHGIIPRAMSDKEAM